MGVAVVALIAALTMGNSGGGGEESVAAASTSSSSGSNSGGGGGAAPATANGVDLSIPYDAAARLAYEKAGSPGDYQAFKTKYEADAVAEVKAKNSISQK